MELLLTSKLLLLMIFLLYTIRLRFAKLKMQFLQGTVCSFEIWQYL